MVLTLKVQQTTLLPELSVVSCQSTPLKDFFYTSGPIFFTLHVEPSVKVCANGHGPLRWPPCPYMVKILKNLLLQNQESFEAESLYIASGIQGLPNLFQC